MSIEQAESSHISSPYLPLEDYALIGDLHTVALVGKNGSIDWCCLPDFDSQSVFCALLDANKGGFFRLALQAYPQIKSMQMYYPGTNVLLTRFLCQDGVAEITDFMSIHSPSQQIIRSLAMVRGSLIFELNCRPAFDYARTIPAVERFSGGVFFRGGEYSLSLTSPYPLTPDRQGGVRACFALQGGQAVHFVLEQKQARGDTPQPLSDDSYAEVFYATLTFWRKWLAQCQYHGRWREMVHRSALVLKLLIYEPTGAIIASPTTSLPESVGGELNWDYRFTWLRDASFTLYSLLSLGLIEEVEAFMGWIDARFHELHRGEVLQPLYGLRGEQHLTEITLPHLEGYRQSSPVRIGNSAYKQKQLNSYGMLIDAIYLYNRHEPISYDLWQNVCHLLTWLEHHWSDSDNGFWERRNQRHPFIVSQLMSWIAFDRARRLASQRGLPAPINEWTRTSARIYEHIMKRGWSDQRQSFVQYDGGKTLDASSLLMGILRFSGASEPRMRETIERIREKLAKGALVHRYSSDMNQKTDAGGEVKGSEGAFAACSFWLAEVLARAGQLEESQLLLEKALTYGNHVGLYAEEIGPSGEALGNYPQALTHLALIIACRNIDRLLDKAHSTV